MAATNWLTTTRRKLLLCMAPIALSHQAFAQSTSSSGWKPFKIDKVDPGRVTIHFTGAYRLVRTKGRYASVDVRLEGGSIDIDQSQSSVYVPQKIQVMLASRLPPPQKGVSLTPNKTGPVLYKEPSVYQVRRGTDTHYDASGPVTSVSFDAGDSDVGNFFIYVMIFVNNDGAFFPALSGNLAP